MEFTKCNALLDCPTSRASRIHGWECWFSLISAVRGTCTYVDLGRVPPAYSPPAGLYFSWLPVFGEVHACVLWLLWLGFIVPAPRPPGYSSLVKCSLHIKDTITIWIKEQGGYGWRRCCNNPLASLDSYLWHRSLRTASFFLAGFSCSLELNWPSLSSELWLWHRFELWNHRLFIG